MICVGSYKDGRHDTIKPSNLENKQLYIKKKKTYEIRNSIKSRGARRSHFLTDLLAPAFFTEPFFFAPAAFFVFLAEDLGADLFLAPTCLLATCFFEWADAGLAASEAAAAGTTLFAMVFEECALVPAFFTAFFEG